MDTRPTSARTSEDGFGSARMEREPSPTDPRQWRLTQGHWRSNALAAGARLEAGRYTPRGTASTGAPTASGGSISFRRPGSDTEASPSPRLDGSPARLFLSGLRGAGIPGSRAPSSGRSVSPVLSEGGWRGVSASAGRDARSGPQGPPSPPRAGDRAVAAGGHGSGGGDGAEAALGGAATGAPAAMGPHLPAAADPDTPAAATPAATAPATAHEHTRPSHPGGGDARSPRGADAPSWDPWGGFWGAPPAEHPAWDHDGHRGRRFVPSGGGDDGVLTPATEYHSALGDGPGGSGPPTRSLRRGVRTEGVLSGRQGLGGASQMGAVPLPAEADQRQPRAPAPLEAPCWESMHFTTDAFAPPDPLPPPVLWSLAQVDYVAMAVERRYSLRGILAHSLLSQIGETPDSGTLRCAPGSSDADPPVWTATHLMSFLPAVARFLGCPVQMVRWEELYASLEDRLQPRPPPAPLQPGRPPLQPRPPRYPAPAPPSAGPAAVAPAASVASASYAPGTPPPDPPQPPRGPPGYPPGEPPAPLPPHSTPPPPIHPALGSPDECSAPHATDVVNLVGDLQPRQPGCIVAPISPHWIPMKGARDYARAYDGASDGFTAFKSHALSYAECALYPLIHEKRQGADYSEVLRKLVSDFLPVNTPLRSTYTPEELGRVVDRHYAHYIAHGGVHAEYRGQRAAGGGQDLIAFWLKEVQARVLPNAQRLQKDFDQWAYPTGVEPNLAVQGFNNKFDQLDAQLYPEVRKAQRFFDAAIAALAGHDFLVRRKEDILAEDKWNALTMEQALRFLNAMVNAKGSEGLLPRSTGGTGGGGSWGNAGGGAASSAGGTTAGGSGGGGGSRNKIITVPAHVLAPAKGKGGKAGGGGGSPPTPPEGSGVSTEAAAKADLVCREGQWQAHQHKTCRLHVLARTPHTQAACKVSASRISTDPQGLFRDMCRKLQEAQQAGQVPRDLSGSVMQAQQFLARAAAPSMTVTIEQAQLQRIEDTLQSVLAMQQLPSSAVSEVAAPVQPAALAWRPPAPPVPLAAPSIAPSHVTATGVHAGPPAAVYRPTHTPVQSPLMPPPPPHTHPPWQPGT
ncbi:hypothetical protein VaNZ11_009709, partial [Volvox africanus]